MGRVLAIDYGKARIGLALSDERAIIAQSLPFLKAGKNVEESASLIIAEFAKHKTIAKIVIGLPLHMSGHESPMSEEVRQLGKLLESLSSVPVTFWDERLSTAQAERSLKEAGMRRKKRTKCVDSLCANLILQNFLDSC